MSADDETERDIALLVDLARQAKRKLVVLGIVMLVTGTMLAAGAVVMTGTPGERIACAAVGFALVAMGGFLAGIGRRSAARLLELVPRIVQGAGVVWTYVDAREVGGGSQLLHLIADDGAEHVMVLPANDVAAALEVVRRRIPKVKLGEDTKLRARFEDDRAGIAKQLATAQTLR